MAVFAELPPLRVHPKLKSALDAYCKQIGVPRAKVLREIIRDFLGPMAGTKDEEIAAAVGVEFTSADGEGSQ